MSGFSLGNISAAAPVAATAPVSEAGSTSQSTAGNVTQLTFRQMQDFFNKWTKELNEQESQFIDDATRVNAWDRTIIVNGDKIAKLQKTVDTVATEHQKLERDLDYLRTQQQEFDSLLQPLENSLNYLGTAAVEPEREVLYNLAEGLDVDLQQMTEDLTEIIRHINDTNKPREKCDPMAQILKILNDHTDALQWIDDNAINLKSTIEDVAEVHKVFRQDHEQSLRGLFKY